jgi:hypothetical protein
VGPSGAKYDGTSLWDLAVGRQPRKAAILFIERPFFDPLILATIACNCFTMAWESPLDRARPPLVAPPLRTAARRYKARTAATPCAPPRSAPRPTRCSVLALARVAAEGTWKSELIDVAEWVYLLIFTMEMVAKITAYGFYSNEEAYLKDAWCQLDFVVVSLAWAPILFPQLNHLSVVRSVRALRPLRALKRVPGMPVLVNSILAALPQLR